MKRLALLFLAACTPKAAPAADAGVVVDAVKPVIVDASAPIIDAAPSASVSASASAPPTAAIEDGPPPANLTLSVVATFSSKVLTLEGRRLTDGFAIGQSSDTGANILTVNKTKPLQVVTGKLKMAGGPFWIWGSTDEIWSTGGGDVHGLRDGDAKTTPKMYRFVVPFRGEQWIGVISHYPPFYMSDSAPNVFEQLHASDAAEEVPKVPKNLQLWSLTALGDGKMCGLGFEEGDAGAEPMRVWSWSSSTNTRSVAIIHGDTVGGGYARTFRGPSGDCVYVFPSGADGQGALMVRRLKDNRIVPVAEDIPHGSFDVTNSGQALWATEDKAHVIRRIDLTTNPPKTTKYALPTKAESCTLGDTIEDIGAVGDDDVWVLASCEDHSHVLLHTQPAGAPIQKIKAP